MVLAAGGTLGGDGPTRDEACEGSLGGGGTLGEDVLVAGPALQRSRSHGGGGCCWPTFFGVRWKRGSAAPEDGLVNVDIGRVRLILERALERVAENWAKAEASVPQGAELQRIVDEGKLALAICLSEPPAVAGRG